MYSMTRDVRARGKYGFGTTNASAPLGVEGSAVAIGIKDHFSLL